MVCPLCEHTSTTQVLTRTDPNYGDRHYHRCERCALIFLLPECRLSPEVERERYGLHENNPQDEGYVTFLNQLVEPLRIILPEGAAGLDFGCGPGPTLSVLLRQHGFSVADYDPAFFPDTALLMQSYDFVVCTETVEHFYHPRQEWETFKGLIRPGGLLGLMTYSYRDIASFKNWWYHREPTHVNFYHADTWQWIARAWGWDIKLLTERVVILFKGQREERV